MSDRDGNYAWEMQQARGNYASDMQRAHYDDRVDPLGPYEHAADRARDDWRNNAPTPSKGESTSGPRRSSTSDESTGEGGGASVNGSSRTGKNVTGQPYLWQRVTKSPLHMLGVPLFLAVLFLFYALSKQGGDAGYKGIYLILSGACLTRAGYKARKLYRTWRARTGPSYGCPVITPGQVIPAPGASTQFDPIYGCPVITPGQVIPPPGASHVQPNTTPMPTIGTPVASTPPWPRPQTTQGSVHIPPTSIRP